ncbi:hypothetical protein LC609_18880 [Nostoc sp. XA013]|nr:hypothetical protein [Nostoc sp. XA013]
MEEKVQTELRSATLSPLVGEKVGILFSLALRHEVRCTAREKMRPYHKPLPFMGEVSLVPSAN